MPLPIKHTVFDIIEKAKSLTDSELEKLLIKNNIIIPTSEFAWKAYKVTAPYLTIIFVGVALDAAFHIRI